MECKNYPYIFFFKGENNQVGKKLMELQFEIGSISYSWWKMENFTSKAWKQSEVVAFAMKKKMRKMLKLKMLPQSGWVGAQGAGQGLAKALESSECQPCCDLANSMQLNWM